MQKQRRLAKWARKWHQTLNTLAGEKLITLTGSPLGQSNYNKARGNRRRTRLQQHGITERRLLDKGEVVILEVTRYILLDLAP